MGNNTTKKMSVINNIKESLLNDIKSKYIIDIIFDYVNKKKILQMVKYNKKLQKKINMSVYDYQNYINKIEIELQIDKNQEEK